MSTPFVPGRDISGREGRHQRRQVPIFTLAFFAANFSSTARIALVWQKFSAIHRALRPREAPSKASRVCLGDIGHVAHWSQVEVWCL